MEGGFDDYDETPEEREYDHYLFYKIMVEDGKTSEEHYATKVCHITVEELRRIVEKYDNIPSKKIDFKNK